MTHPEPQPATPLAPPNPCGPARSDFDLFGAFRLVYKSYGRSGLCVPSPLWMHLSPFALLPDAVVFIARHDGAVVSTLTLFADGPLGLPADETFADRCGAQRTRGRRIAEIGMVADRRMVRPGRLGYLAALFKMACDYARVVLRADDLFAVMPPHQVYLFESCLGFKHEAEPRQAKALNRHMAMCLRLDLGGWVPDGLSTGPLGPAIPDEAASLHALADRYTPTPGDLELLLPLCEPAEGPRARVRDHLAATRDGGGRGRTGTEAQRTRLRRGVLT